MNSEFTLVLHQKDGELERDEAIALDADTIFLGRGQMSGPNFVRLLPCGNRVSKVHATLARDPEDRRWWLHDGELGGQPSTRGIWVGEQRFRRVQVVQGMRVDFLRENGWHIWLEAAGMEDTAQVDRTIPPVEDELGRAILALREEMGQLSSRISQGAEVDQQFAQKLSGTEKQVEQAIARNRAMFQQALAEQAGDFRKELLAANSNLSQFQRRAQSEMAVYRRQIQRLTRLVCGLGLVVGLVGGAAWISDPRADEHYTQILMHLLAAIAGGGGLLASERITERANGTPIARAAPRSSPPPPPRFSDVDDMETQEY